MIGVLNDYSLGSYPTWILDTLGSPNPLPIALADTDPGRDRIASELLS